MGKKLLVADDSLTIQKVIKLALSGEGYEIQTVSDGTEVIAQIATFRPDAVLIDVALPGRSAFDLKLACNQDPDLSKTPFVLMSGAYEKVDEARVSSLHFEGRLAKPFDPSTLKQALNQVLKTPGSGPIPPRPPAIDMVIGGNPPPPPATALFMKKPDSPTVIEFNDDLWEQDKPKKEVTQETRPFTLSPSQPTPPAPPKAPPALPPMPDLTASSAATEQHEPVADLSPETLQDDLPSLEPYKRQDLTGPKLDFLPSNPKKPASPPEPMSFGTANEESDIRHLTESTVKMSGLDDLDGWNINESAKSTVLPPIPGIFESADPNKITQNSDAPESLGSSSPLGSLDMDSTKELPDFELTGIGVTGPKTLSPDIPSANIEEIVEKQVRSQIEYLVQQKVKEVLEQMSKDQLPEIAERVMKQEIRRLLESLGEMN